MTSPLRGESPVRGMGHPPREPESKTKETSEKSKATEHATEALKGVRAAPTGRKAPSRARDLKGFKKDLNTDTSVEKKATEAGSVAEKVIKPPLGGRSMFGGGVNPELAAALNHRGETGSIRGKKAEEPVAEEKKAAKKDIPDEPKRLQQPKSKKMDPPHKREDLSQKIHGSGKGWVGSINVRLNPEDESIGERNKREIWTKKEKQVPDEPKTLKGKSEKMEPPHKRKELTQKIPLADPDAKIDSITIPIHPKGKWREELPKTPLFHSTAEKDDFEAKFGKFGGPVGPSKVKNEPPSVNEELPRFDEDWK
jgi:hypothetical protein